jgi:hypothetical protein
LPPNPADSRQEFLFVFRGMGQGFSSPSKVI